MPKMNFEQAPSQRHPRDIGGPPGSALLLVATALVTLMFGLLLRGSL